MGGYNTPDTTVVAVEFDTRAAHEVLFSSATSALELGWYFDPITP